MNEESSILLNFYIILNVNIIANFIMGVKQSKRNNLSLAWFN